MEGAWWLNWRARFNNHKPNNNPYIYLGIVALSGLSKLIDSKAVKPFAQKKISSNKNLIVTTKSNIL